MCGQAFFVKPRERAERNPQPESPSQARMEPIFFPDLRDPHPGVFVSFCFRFNTIRCSIEFEYNLIRSNSIEVRIQLHIYLKPIFIEF